MAITTIGAVKGTMEVLGSIVTVLSILEYGKGIYDYNIISDDISIELRKMSDERSAMVGMEPLFYNQLQLMNTTMYLEELTNNLDLLPKEILGIVDSLLYSNNFQDINEMIKFSAVLNDIVKENYPYATLEERGEVYQIITHNMANNNMEKLQNYIYLKKYFNGVEDDESNNFTTKNFIDNVIELSDIDNIENLISSENIKKVNDNFKYKGIEFNKEEVIGNFELYNEYSDYVGSYPGHGSVIENERFRLHIEDIDGEKVVNVYKYYKDVLNSTFYEPIYIPTKEEVYEVIKEDDVRYNEILKQYMISAIKGYEISAYRENRKYNIETENNLPILDREALETESWQQKTLNVEWGEYFENWEEFNQLLEDVQYIRSIYNDDNEINGAKGDEAPFFYEEKVQDNQRFMEDNKVEHNDLVRWDSMLNHTMNRTEAMYQTMTNSILFQPFYDYSDDMYFAETNSLGGFESWQSDIYEHSEYGGDVEGNIVLESINKLNELSSIYAIDGSRELMNYFVNNGVSDIDLFHQAFNDLYAETTLSNYHLAKLYEMLSDLSRTLEDCSIPIDDIAEKTIDETIHLLTEKLKENHVSTPSGLYRFGGMCS